MNRYTTIGNSIISVNLENNYQIIAIIKKTHEENQFLISLYLKHNDVDILDAMDRHMDILLFGSYKNIKNLTVKYIHDCLLQKRPYDITYYITRYEYYTKCFNKGLDILENQEI